MLIEGSSTSGYSTINVYEQVAVSTTRNALEINFESKSPSTHTSKGLSIDYDLVAPTSSSTTATAIGVDIDMDISATAIAGSYANMTGINMSYIAYVRA